MCGLFGIVHLGRAADPRQVAWLTDLVAHRGPDGCGVWSEGNLGLGHRRLAIQELTPLGAQPMHHLQHPLTVVHNGEIYNHEELRQELEAMGHKFRGRSDTEVILAAWLQWGPGCLERFNGMWAFALADRRSGELFVARDRFGVKPLYWARTADAVAIASEIRQLRPLLERIEPEPALVRDYLTAGLTDHTAKTWTRGIEQLPGGHWLRINTTTLEITKARWYTLRPSAEAAQLDPAAAADALGALLADAVRLRLRSDVPVGTCLSGGLDSSSIAALAAQMYRADAGQEFRAITAVSTEAATNEETYAAQVVQACGLHWIRVTPSFDDFQSSLDAVLCGQEEPFCSPSVYMQYFVMQTARANGITVLLDGQGGDETLLGYARYYGAWLLERWRHGGAPAVLRGLREMRAANARMGLARTAAYVMGSLFAPLRTGAGRWRYPFLRDARLPAALQDFAHSTRNPVAMQALELGSTNLPMLLRYEDRNSMQHGIETRLPFLDWRLVEFALGLQACVKMQGGWVKWPLRQAMHGRLPETIAWRRNKIGFDAPARSWLDHLLPIMRSEILQSRYLGEHVDLKRLAPRIARLDDRMLWRLFNTQRWAAQAGLA
jgi:asparagine synthase (glutamine-hydrolysing)